MRRAQLQVLEDLMLIPSPSGFEKGIATYIEGELQDLPQVQISRDRQHNVSVVIPGKTDSRVMIDAHMDQLGFIVHNIDAQGFVSISQLGWGDTEISSARNITILGEKKNIAAVVNRQHSHLVSEDDDHVPSMDKAIVDTGTRDANVVKRHVRIGDPAVHTLSFTGLLGNCCTGPGLDDKSGCAVLLDVISRISKGKMRPIPTLIFTFSTQEETCSKWGPLIRRHEPDLFVEMDVTFATDWSYDDQIQYECGSCLLGRGPVIYRGIGIDEEYQCLMAKIASDHNIPTQVLAVNEPEPTISNAREGTAFVNIGIPLRNMHTPVETVSIFDLDCSVKMLHRFLLSRKLLAV